MIGRVLLGAIAITVLVGFGLAFASSFPDLVRYMKMRQM